MKKFYQIDEFFPATGDERFSLSAESPLDEVTYNIFTADDFTDAAIYDYGERKFLCPETDTPLASFHARFSRWKAQRGADIAAAFGALRMEYDPIQNYKSVETKSGTETALKTPDEWVTTVERTPDLTRTETQTPSGWTKTTTDSATNYHETTTETPGLNRGYSETESFTNYHETETQTPTNWKESTVEGVGQNGYHEIETQTPTDWTETTIAGVGEDGYKESDLQTPTNWKETTTKVKADNEVEAESSIYAFNSATAVPTGKSVAKTNEETDVERTGTYLTEHEIEGTKETSVTRSGSFETDKEITGSKEIEVSHTGTFETDKEITGSKETEVSHTGTFETDLERTGTKTIARTETGTLESDKTITGTKTSEEVQSGTFETGTTETGTDTTTTSQAGTFEDKMTYDTTLTRAGNIGVTTSQQMINSELDLRARQFVREVIREFFDLVTVYC